MRLITRPNSAPIYDFIFYFLPYLLSRRDAVCHFPNVPLTFKRIMSYQIAGNNIKCGLINQSAGMTPFYISQATRVVYQPHFQKVNVCVSDADVADLAPSSSFPPDVRVQIREPRQTSDRWGEKIREAAARGCNYAARICVKK